MEKVVIAVNPLEYTDDLIDTGLQMSQQFGASAVFLSIINEPAVICFPESAVIFENSALKEQQNMAVTLFDEWQHRNTGRMMEQCVLIGEPRTNIINFINSVDARILIIGTHGRTGVEHFLVGSTAEYIIRHSCIPVLVVPFRKTKH